MVRGVLQGDRAAEAALLERIVPHLRAVATAILVNRADVDDAVQVALMRVLKGLQGFRGESTLVRWSRRVATHACLRVRDGNRRRLSVVEPTAEPESVGVAPSTTSGSSTPELKRYLDQLPDKQREALILRHVLEYSVVEIAELVDAPVDTVKSRLLYGRRAMRAMIRRDAAMTPQPHKGVR